MTASATSGKTVGEALAWAEARLRVAGVSSADTEARFLLAERLSCAPALLFVKRAEAVGSALDGFEADVERRARREPADYIHGYSIFFGKRFAVDPRVLVPRPETELLVEAAIAAASRTKVARVLDVGAGSGAISVSLALQLGARVEVTALDISEDALKVAAANALRLGATEIRFLKSDVYQALRPEFRGYFDIIVANPPYVATPQFPALEPELSFEPRIALDGGPDGLGVIRRLVAEAPEFLRPGGRLLTEIGFDQASAVSSLFDAAGFGGVTVSKDLSGHDRLISGDISGPV
ncbi:MAG: peptide chain release factor N(5)-glutamine methyltransferase [Elusimicrobia bacterium]|nr:peptide chain release factor N(5)-glutamine methyltransferase [Elusimicrobiota bacterium]